MALLGAASGAISADEPQGSSKDDGRAERLKQMREVIGGIRAVEIAGDVRAPVEAAGEPILRFGDAARDHQDGTVWIWGRSGRPVAIMELYKNIHGVPIWAMAMSSLSSGQVRLQGNGGWLWAPSRAGVEPKPLSQAEAPAADPVVRLRQMKQMAIRFRAHEFWDPDNQRFELRLLSRPAHRYRDAKAGLLDGALFLFCHGTNPEVVLLIEAAGKHSSPEAWQYALTRLGHAEMHVSVDDREVWQCPRVDSMRPSEPYYLVIEPAVGPRTQ